jgi:hypothetical protein
LVNWKEIEKRKFGDRGGGGFSETLVPMADPEQWPALPLNEWMDTYRTLHLWTQIVGKVRMALAPPLNHWWNVTLYVNSRGLTTGPAPYDDGIFEIQFNFLWHKLEITTSQGGATSRSLRPEPVAEFYRSTLESLTSLGIFVEINRKPQEVAGPVPFDEDYTHRSYDPEYARRFWRILVSTAKVLERFRAKFKGKSSPVHFFWGELRFGVYALFGTCGPGAGGIDQRACLLA